MDEFNSVVTWPEDDAHASVVGAAESPVMEEEDEDNDFENVEEGEEEDD